MNVCSRLHLQTGRGGATMAATLFLSWAGLACAASEPTCRAVSPAEPLATAHPAPGPVLFVVTAAGEQRLANGKTRATGSFLNELYEPYRAVREAGYQVVFATPGGRPAVVDPESLDPGYWKQHPEWLAEAQQWVATSEALRQPWTLEEAREREQGLAGLVVPGGQGVMIDLLEDRDLHALIVRMGETRRAVGLICHAPAILTRLSGAANPFSGRAVTSVSGLEELFIETFVMGGKAQVRGIGAELSRQGYRHAAAFPGRGHAVRDCNLVTSQNPYSGEHFNALYLAALADWRAGVRCDCPSSAALAGRCSP